jgi:hypothetical protein
MLPKLKTKSCGMSVRATAIASRPAEAGPTFALRERDGISTA